MCLLGREKETAMTVIDLFRRAILSSSLETLELLESYPLAPYARELVAERATALREMSKTSTRELVMWVSPSNKTLVMGTREEYALDIA